MDKQTSFADSPALDGPDYVALVIEWDALDDQIADELAAAPTEPIRLTEHHRLRAISATVAVVGVVGALTLIGKCIHRLRAA